LIVDWLLISYGLVMMKKVSIKGLFFEHENFITLFKMYNICLKAIFRL